MIANALRLASEREASAVNEETSSLFQARSAFRLGYDGLPERADGRLRKQYQRIIPSASIFLIVMVAISLAFQICGRLVGPALLGHFGPGLDPFGLAVARQSIVTLLGILIAGGFSKHATSPAQRQYMLLTPLLALGVGLILSWLSQLAGQSGALDWLVILVYLLWAWGSVVSAAKG